MTEHDYKATPEQWAQCEEWIENPVVGASDACILELRARVETLEAAVHKYIIETSGNILALASRVEALEAGKRSAPSEARAAIREVAAWLIDRKRDDDWLAPFEELADLLLEEAQR
jgi:hypothetical protein